MKNGGMRVASDDTANTTVTSVPLSAEVRAPICFRSFLAMTPMGRWTVINPLSSMLENRSVPMPITMSFSMLLKKASALWRLKLVALLNEVA